MARTKYITGEQLCQEIWLSKLSFCYSLDPLPDPVIKCQFSHSGDDLPEDMTGYVRHFTLDHIPLADRKQGGAKRRNADHIWTNFRPFKIYYDGQEVIRSHWQGGFENGTFSMETGKHTRRLSEYMMKLVERYSTKPNWAGYTYIDDMRSIALLNLSRGILTFDDTRLTQTGQANSFAFATQIVQNSFLRVWRDEKKVQQLRDRLLFEMGANPSFGFEGDDLA